MPLRMRVHDREPIGLALRRFKKLLERSGVTKELRNRKYYEKPCELRRRAALRKKSTIRKAKLLGGLPSPPRVAWPAQEFVLVRSTPSREGSRYQVLGRFHL